MDMTPLGEPISARPDENEKPRNLFQARGFAGAGRRWAAPVAPEKSQARSPVHPWST
jgi:hypothetical protein